MNGALVIASSIALAALAGCVDRGPGPQGKRIEPSYIRGNLLAEESVIIRPEIDGRITALPFNEGQAVPKGAKLVALDAAEYEAQKGGFLPTEADRTTRRRSAASRCARHFAGSPRASGSYSSCGTSRTAPSTRHPSSWAARSAPSRARPTTRCRGCESWPPNWPNC